MFKMFKMLFMLVVSFSFIGFSQSANELLKSVQNKFSGVNTFSANFTQNSSSGKIYYQKENKYRAEFSGLTLVSDGSTIWSYNTKDKKVVINDFNAESAMSIDKVVYDYPAKSNITIEGNNVLVFTPKKGSKLSFKEVKLWINKDNLVSKISVKKGNQNPMVIELSDYSINSKIDNSKFTFTPPKGSEVIDLR